MREAISQLVQMILHLFLCATCIALPAMQLISLRGISAALANAQGGNIQVFLDCEGRDLGRHGGKLGLVQLGIEEEIYNRRD